VCLRRRYMSLSGIHTTSTISDEVASSTAIQVSSTEPAGSGEFAIRRPTMRHPNASDSRVMATLRERLRNMRRHCASVNSSNGGRVSLSPLRSRACQKENRSVACLSELLQAPVVVRPWRQEACDKHRDNDPPGQFGPSSQYKVDDVHRRFHREHGNQ